MLTVVHDENESNEHAPAAVGGSMLDEMLDVGGDLSLQRRSVPGGC